MVHSPGLGRVGTRKVLEVKAFFGELLSAGKTFPIGVQFKQNVMVTRQDAVDSSDYIDLFVRLFVVIAVAARVAAELFVHAPDDGFTAVEAFSFFHSISYSVIQLFSCSVIQLVQVVEPVETPSLYWSALRQAQGP